MQGIGLRLRAVLQAEKDLNVTGNPISLTATFSFAMIDGRAPGLSQMEDFYECLKNDTRKAPTNYTAKNDLLAAYKARWVNSFNTANPAGSVRQLMFDKYNSTFWNSEIKIPLFIGEYHAPHFHLQKDMEGIVALTLDKKYPFFLGMSFFEFSVRYDKGGTEKEFGMFGYGNCTLSVMDYWGTDYNIRNLVPAKDKFGQTIFESVRAAFGGRGEPIFKGAPCTNPVRVS